MFEAYIAEEGYEIDPELKKRFRIRHGQSEWYGMSINHLGRFHDYEKFGDRNLGYEKCCNEVKEEKK